MKSKVGILGASALAGVIALSGLGMVASAQTPPAGNEAGPHPARVAGRVIQVGTNGLQIETRRGSVSATVSDATWIVVERDGKCVEGAISDIKAQQLVAVGGMTAGTAKTEVAARTISQGKCIAKGIIDNRRAQGRLAKNGALGDIKSISGNSIVVTTRRGEATIVTSAGTVVINSGFQPVGALKVGDSVAVVQGAKSDKPTSTGSTTEAQSRTINASVIRVISASTQLRVGRVEAISGNSVTLKTGRNRDVLTVNFDATTTYKSGTVIDKQLTLVNAAQADIKVGSMMTIEVAVSADGKSAQAYAVIIMPNRDKKTKP